MARIFTAGNEFGDWMADGFEHFAGTLTTSRNQRFAATSPGGSGGEWSLYLTSSQGVQFNVANIVPGGIDEFYLRFHMHPGFRSDGTWERLRLTTDTGAILLRYVTVDNGNGSLNGGLFYNAFYNSAGSLFLSNTTFAHRNNEWHLVEMYVKFAGSGGRVKLWFNEQLEMDWTGSLVGPSAETQLSLLRPFYGQISGGGANSTYYDDFALNDTTGPTNNGRIGDGYVIRLAPNDNGSSSQCFNPSGTSVDNFKFINRLPALNETGFVGPTAVNDKDLYQIDEPPAEFHGVNSIKITANAVRHGNAITKLKGLLKPPTQLEIDSPAGVGAGAALPVGAEDYVNIYFENNPNTGNEPFTIDELRDMEAGFQFIA